MQKPFAHNRHTQVRLYDEGGTDYTSSANTGDTLQRKKKSFMR